MAHPQRGLQSGPREEHHHHHQHRRRARRRQRQNTARAADTRDAHHRDDGSARTPRDGATSSSTRTARRCAPSPGRNARISASSSRAMKTTKKRRPRRWRRTKKRGRRSTAWRWHHHWTPRNSGSIPSDILHEDMCLQEALRVTGRDRATDTEATEEQHRHLPPLEDIRPQGANEAMHRTTAADRVENLATEDFHGAQSILLPGRRTYEDGNDPEEDHHDPAFPREEEPPEQEPALGENPPDPGTSTVRRQPRRGHAGRHAIQGTAWLPPRGCARRRQLSFPCLDHRRGLGRDSSADAPARRPLRCRAQQRRVERAAHRSTHAGRAHGGAKTLQPARRSGDQRHTIPLLRGAHEYGQSVRHHPLEAHIAGMVMGREVLIRQENAEEWHRVGVTGAPRIYVQHEHTRRQHFSVLHIVFF